MLEASIAQASNKAQAANCQEWIKLHVFCTCIASVWQQDVCTTTCSGSGLVPTAAVIRGNARPWDRQPSKAYSAELLQESQD
jgi:hypothetical protein